MTTCATAYLNGHGYSVLRFWNNDVLQNTCTAAAEADPDRGRCAATPHPAGASRQPPSPRGEKGRLMPAPGENLRINPDRLWDSIHEMAEIGPGIAGGSNRQTLTDDDKTGPRAVQALVRRGRDDAWASTRWAPCSRGARAPIPSALPVYVGSHLDTQPTGGRYDGVLGVLGGARGRAHAQRSRHQDQASDRRHQLDQRGRRAVCAGDAGVGRVRRHPHARLCLWPQGPRGQDLRRRAQAHRLGRRRAGRRAEDARLLRVPHRAGADPRGRGQADRRRDARPGAVVARVHADRQGGAYRLDADDHARQCRARDGAHPRDGAGRSR